MGQLAPTFIGAGIAFLLALLVGRLMARFHLPRVTGYLVTGLLVDLCCRRGFRIQR